METLDVDAMSLWSLWLVCGYNRATEKQKEPTAPG